MIALKLNLSFRWNHHTKFRRSLRNKHTAVNYNEYPWNANDEFFLEDAECQNASSDSSDQKRLSESSDMDSSSDDPDWKLQSIVV